MTQKPPTTRRKVSPWRSVRYQAAFAAAGGRIIVDMARQGAAATTVARDGARATHRHGCCVRVPVTSWTRQRCFEQSARQIWPRAAIGAAFGPWRHIASGNPKVPKMTDCIGFPAARNRRRRWHPLAPSPSNPRRIAPMDIASNVATSRLVAQQRAMDVIADNIANANTPGFKAQRMQFSDWLSPQKSAAPQGGGTIAYTQDRATWREQQVGTLSHTGNPLDLALGRDGYFTVQTPNGSRLTRDGRFGLLRQRHAGGQCRRRGAGQQRPTHPVLAHRHADHYCRRRHRLHGERSARQGRCGQPQRPDAALRRGQHAVPRRRHHHRPGRRARRLCRVPSRTPTSSPCSKRLA